MREAVIVDCLRTPVGKAPRGALRNTRPDDLGAIAIRALLDHYPAAADQVGVGVEPGGLVDGGMDADVKQERRRAEAGKDWAKLVLEAEGT